MGLSNDKREKCKNRELIKQILFTDKLLFSENNRFCATTKWYLRVYSLEKLNIGLKELEMDGIIL